MHSDKKWPIFFGYLFKFLSQIKEFLLSFRIPGMSFFFPNKPRNILSIPLAEFLASRIKRLSFSVHLCDAKVAALSTQFSLRWEGTFWNCSYHSFCPSQQVWFPTASASGLTVSTRTASTNKWKNPLGAATPRGFFPFGDTHWKCVSYHSHFYYMRFYMRFCKKVKLWQYFSISSLRPPPAGRSSGG